jgi:hypothetical protein
MGEYSKDKILDGQHWQFYDYHQRVDSKVWRELLLNDDDKIIMNGRLHKLKGKRLGFGVVEISKELKGHE